MVALPTAVASPIASLVVRAVGFWTLPPLDLTGDQVAECAALADSLGDGAELQPTSVGTYDLLRWLATNRPYLFHGSSRSDLTELRPVRMSSDPSAFGNQQAVYATDDPVWASFFGVLDRGTPTFKSMRNGSITVIGRPRLGTRYFLSVNEEAGHPAPLRDSCVYLVDRAGFEPEAPEFGVLHTAQWAKPAVVPIVGKVAVVADDFPFRDRILSHRLGESEIKTYLKLALRRR